MPPVGRSAAFFDLDNTLVRGSSLIHLARGLYKRKYFTTRGLVRGLWMEATFRAGGERKGHITSVRDSLLQIIAGRRVDELTEAARATVDDVLADRFWPGARELAATHLEAGRPVWLVTASPAEVAAIVADRLGFTGAIGTVAEHVEGIYTGKLTGGLIHGDMKAVAVQELAEVHGYDLAESYAYSDSMNDLPMLNLVGHPFVVNPEPALARHAATKGWPVHDFRTTRHRVKRGALLVAAASAATLLARTGARIRANAHQKTLRR